MTIRALGHHVLVKVYEPDQKSKGGILIPEQVRAADQRGAEIGTIVDVGPTAWKADGLGGEPWAKVGDKIWFAKYAGKWVKDSKTDEQLLILLDTDIVAQFIEE